MYSCTFTSITFIYIENVQPKAQDAAHSHKVPQNKVADLKEMLKYMPLLDKEYYKATFNNIV